MDKLVQRFESKRGQLPHEQAVYRLHRTVYQKGRAMRKHQKKEIQNFIKLLHEAHDEIKKSIGVKSFEQAMALLGQCQEATIQIGVLIEELEGEGSATIRLIEQYCEALYQVHEALEKHQELAAGKVHKTLRKQLIEIENSVKNDIPVQTETAFLPYKASMWDSLESAWKAAEEDENCDAYVIPIPYYDRNPDGSFGERHYEGALYPDYVPLTHYEDYSLEERHPDMIYIHNPYDGQNLVTSVHPAFYSEQLKQYTDCLVYIPYFILPELDPKDRNTVEKIAHFCTAPGVLHADKVIVQSENIRQIYVDVLTETFAAGQNQAEVNGLRQYWEDKIEGTGSPKIDKVMNTKKEDLKIPEDWMRIIEKPDGEWKKIIFYNISIGAFLQQNEKMLKKIVRTFEIFEAEKTTTALLWRPHPLLESTLTSMRPQLWEQYKKIRDKYRNDGWGIYDDTADIDRAVVLSDAYYGDQSSVVQLFQKLAKPVLLQHVGVL